MPQKHKNRKPIIAGIIAVLGLSLLFIRPEASMAASSMEINGNGCLVRYNIKDGAKRVSIPTNVKAIGNEAFSGDKSLEGIVIPGSVKVIGSKAFYGCENLKEIYLQYGTESIGDSAFAMCTGLSRVQLPETLKNFGNGVFAGDGSLDNISIAGTNRNFFLNDNVLYNRDSTRLIEMAPGRQGDIYVMPFSVRSIAPYAFWGAENLKRVRVSNNVSSITPFAFTNANGMEFVYLPNSVNSIEEYAFRDCKNLKYIATEGSIGFIADSAFEGTETLSDNTISLEEAERKYKKLTGADKKEGGKKKSVSGDSAEEAEGQVSDGGEVVFNTPWGIRAPYKEIDTSDPNLYGTGKIVGGRTVIIPTKKQDYSGLSRNSIE